ncbi:uncharacterized protein LOC132280783 isoform X2 [Cornus florida]|uniref:uncharacterized protein LOC132280783 isoform X2 n=1 Tax=Cornus florida TaxID=4283 RepID=UPI0028977A34|nr:uncharacterized protein LOC132280783 isoform X2 [Cornus florida]
MSRCFPYPPPGYEKIGNPHEALIESIKIGEKSKKERKDKKRERKEEKKKQKIGETEKNKHGHKKRHKKEGSHDGKKGREHQKMMRNEKEQFEKSTLTEEHGHPFGSQNLSDSSDSTLNSNRRQEHGLPSDGRHNPGSVIRIRFQKNKDQEVLPNKELPCSAALGSSDGFVQEMNEPAPGPSAKGRDHLFSTISTQDASFKLSKGEPRCFSEVLSQRAETAPTSCPCVHRGSSSLLKLRDLIENWVPPLLQSERPNLDDHEWLYSTKQDHNFGARRFKASGDGLSYQCSTPWPRVCYLPEADIHALPFVLPY